MKLIQENKSKILPVNYPKSLDENVKYRIQLVQACVKDKALLDDVRNMCAKNIIFWIDLFCWTKDPRREYDVLPFICYDSYQPETILAIEAAIDGQYDLLGEKSRDMGASWMVLYVLHHKFLFENGSDFRIGSRKEEFVDRPGDIDTLFEKLRFNHDKQPWFLMPQGWDWRKHATYMRMINPECGNSIIGESANVNFGSGGRRKALMLDEFSKWDDSIAKGCWTSTADVTRCRIPISTPLGGGNKFAILAKGTKEKIKKFTLHWTLHPEKNKGAYILTRTEKLPINIEEDPKAAYHAWQQHKGERLAGVKGCVVRSVWYDAECERRSEADVAQELDIDYLQSGYPFFDLQALQKQSVWTLVARSTPYADIPIGHFIRANIISLDHKTEIREIDGGWLKIYELPQKGFQYVFSADTSEGLPKGDESFGVVRDKYTRNVVAICNGLFTPDDFAIKCQKIGQFYNNAKVAVENNNHGYSVCSDLKQLDCNLYYTKRRGKDGNVTGIKAGWTTSSTSRPQMLDQMAEEIRMNAIELRDEDIITQCETFVKNEKTGKPEADGDFLDDAIIAVAIGGMVIQELPYIPTPTKKPGRDLTHREKNAKFKFKKRD